MQFTLSHQAVHLVPPCSPPCPTMQSTLSNHAVHPVPVSLEHSILEHRVGICPRVLEREPILYPFITLLAVCVRTLWQSIIYYILLAAISGVSGVFAYYPHPGGQGLTKPLSSTVYFRIV